MDAEPEVLDLVAVKLPVGRVATEVLEHELELPVEEGHFLELDAAAKREVGIPVVLFAVLDIEGRHGPEGAIEEGPGAPDLDPGLHRPRRKLGRVVVEDVPTAAVDPEPLGGIVGELEVNGFETQVDSLDAVAQEELVAEVGALVEHA